MPIIDEIRNAYNNKEYANTLPYPSRNDEKYKHQVVKTETVLWNEEQTELKKQQYTLDYKAYQEENARLSSKLHDDMVEAIQEEYHVNAEQAAKIYGYAYSEKHSCMSDVFGFVHEMADLYEELRKME